MSEIISIKNANYYSVLKLFFWCVLSLLMGMTCAAWVAKLLVLKSAMTGFSCHFWSFLGGFVNRNKMSCIFAKITHTDFCDFTTSEGVD